MIEGTGVVELTIRTGLSALREGNLSEAVLIFEKALALEEVRDDPHATVDVANSLGVAYRLLRRFAEAETRLLEALRIGREKLGGDHLLVARVLENLATLKYLSGEVVRGREFVIEAISSHCARAADPRLTQEVATTLLAIEQR